MGATLASDILEVLDGRKPVSPEAGKPELWGEAAVRMAQHTSRVLVDRTPGPDRLRDRILWASELGEDCDRKLWYKFHTPASAEPLRGATKFKFAYGNIIEEMALTYAVAAGYEVSHQQALLTEVLANGWTVRGRIDGVVSKGGASTVVDVKSASSGSYSRYVANGVELHPFTDTFGYIQQLQFYDYNRSKLAGLEDSFWQRAEFLFIDKQLGKLHSMTYKEDTWGSYRSLKGSEKFDELMHDVESMPPRAYKDVTEGASGNKRLGTKCSYCDFKLACWPGLRAFKYSTGPKFLTEVKVEPKVPEIPLESVLTPKLPEGTLVVQDEIPF